MKKIINMCDKLINQVMSLIDNSYKDFGNKSKVIKPMRVIGKKYITIGKNVIINNGIRLEAIDKWLDETYDPEIIINDGVAIGQNCHITAANRIFIGRGSSIMPDVLITDIEHMYIQGKSLSETNMGARIIGHRKLHIGDNAVIGANSVVTKDIPDNTVAVGVPARIIK